MNQTGTKRKAGRPPHAEPMIGLHLELPVALVAQLDAIRGNTPRVVAIRRALSIAVAVHMAPANGAGTRQAE